VLSHASERTHGAVRALKVVGSLMGRLRAEDIPYCHWKSNEHLVDALLGRTDLDMLVERGASPRLEEILSERGFKRFAAVAGRGYPGVEDWIGFDPDSGSMVHLHLHYELTLGEKHLKGYHLPWESVILATRRYDDAFAVFVTDPSLEWLLLLVRMMLKIRLRDRVFASIGRSYVRSGDRRELDWLRSQVEPGRLRQFATDLLGTGAADLVCESVANGPHLGLLLRLRRLVRPRLRLHRTYGALGARLRRLVGEYRWLRASVGRRLMRSVTPLRRVSPRGGLLIAFMGADGSGKSTLVGDTVRWLGWKLDARPVYFGSGDGPTSILRWPLKMALSVLRAAGLTGTGRGARSAGGAPVSRPRPWYVVIGRIPWALALSWEKRRTLRLAWRARNRGMLILCDRYPQNQVTGFNDGPLLGHWRDRRSALLRWLARWEETPYQRAQACPPDLVIKLRVSPEAAIRRKPEVTEEETGRRNRAITDLRYPASTRLLEVDADRNLDEIVLQVRRFIWSAL